MKKKFEKAFGVIAIIGLIILALLMAVFIIAINVGIVSAWISEPLFPILPKLFGSLFIFAIDCVLIAGIGFKIMEEID